MNSSSFKLLDFRKINIQDQTLDIFNTAAIDMVDNAWSRVYEYPLVLNEIKKEYPNNSDIKIHNTSWGFQGIHITFKNYLDSIYKKVLHTDIKKSSFSNTDIYDITKEPSKEYINNFDIVINISTLEEVKFDHIKSFSNLFTQVKNGGLLIITFDLPGLQLEKFENLFNVKIKESSQDINGLNSIVPNKRYKKLSCGIIVLKKQ